MVKRIVVCLVALSAMVVLTAGPSFAEEKAVTGQLPAALQAAAVQPNQVLSSATAHSIRGEGAANWLNGRMVFWGGPFNGVVEFRSSRPVVVNLVMTSNVAALRIR
jgi:hypothetical protein